MNVSELSSALYRQAGVDAAALRRLNSTRRNDGPAALGEDHSEGPKFSDVLAQLAAKHMPAAADTAADTVAAPALSEKQIGAVLKNALSSDNISSDLVNALTDDPDLLDKIFSMSSDDDDDNEYLSDMLKNDDTDGSLNKMLTDINTAREYLSSSSGRELMVAMAQRSLSGLVE